jgi:hypothetical protein
VDQSNKSSVSKKRKEPNEPQKTRGVRLDYCHLNDLYSEDEEEADEDDEEETHIIEVLTAKVDDEFQSLKEAKESPTWLEWENAIRTKLDQHQEKGTWELVDKPPDTVPLANKWVFVTKRYKEGVILKNKAQLVVKGYNQQPGNYSETHSPVI